MIKSQTLQDYRFTNGDDKVAGLNLEVDPGQFIDALAGNDAIVGISLTDDALFIEAGYLLTSAGDDIVLGISLVDSGRGPRDRGHGIHLVGGILDTGSGDDVVIGANSSRGRAGILTLGLISTDDGDDAIIGVATRSSGIRVDFGGVLATGDGNDVITGIALSDEFGSSVFVDGGAIDMGAGDDLLDVNSGGIRGKGEVTLGAGNDTFSGFTDLGTFQLDGGKGTDLIALPDGAYSITIDQGFVTFTNGQTTLEALNFELVRIGGQSFSVAALENNQVLSA